MSNLKMCILCGCSFEPETTDQVTCKNCYSKTIKNVDKYRVAYLGQWIVVDNEYFQVTEGIKEIDPNAFFVATDAYEVKGGR